MRHSASPAGSWFEMHMLRSHPRPRGSETVEVQGVQASVFTQVPQASLLHTQAQEPLVLGDPTLPNPLMASSVTNSLSIWLLNRYISSLVPWLMHPDRRNTDHINQDPIYLTSIDCRLLNA